jgi:glycine reductase
MRIVHCLNQFFAGIGGEEHAGIAPRLLRGPRGPGALLESLAPDVEIVATLVFGDNDLAQRSDAALAEILDLIRGAGDADLLIAGPAFAAGRYGIGCAAICRAVRETLELPAITGLFPDNPAVPAYRRDVPMVATAPDVMGMREALERLLAAGRKLARGERLEPERDGVLPRGLRRNIFVASSGAERAVAMLLAKLRAEPYTSEYAMPVFDRVPPAPALPDATRATLALVTSGGIVPAGNPDRIESANASRFGAYSLAGLDALSAATHQTVHGGYDPTFANADPNRVLPLDVVRDLEREDAIGRLHERYYATVGNGTSVDRARRFGEEIAAQLVRDGVQAVILTST